MCDNQETPWIDSDIAKKINFFFFLNFSLMGKKKLKVIVQVLNVFVENFSPVKIIINKFTKPISDDNNNNNENLRFSF